VAVLGARPGRLARQFSAIACAQKLLRLPGSGAHPPAEVSQDTTCKCFRSYRKGTTSWFPWQPFSVAFSLASSPQP